MECFSLGACVSHLKRGTGAFTFYLRFSSVMVLLSHGARTTLLLAPFAPSGRPCGTGYLAPLGSHRALPFQEITPTFVSFESLSGMK